MDMTMGGQAAFLLYSCVVGIILGILYDVFRIIRAAFNSGFLSVFIQDFLYCILSAFLALVFVFYANSGQIRWYAVLGCLLFFILYHLTVGKLVMFVSKKIIALIKKLLHLIYLITIRPVKISIGFICGLIVKILRFMGGKFVYLYKYISFKKQTGKSVNEALKGYNLLSPEKRRRLKMEKSVKNPEREGGNAEKKNRHKTGKGKNVHIG